MHTVYYAELYVKKEKKSDFLNLRFSFVRPKKWLKMDLELPINEFEENSY